MKKVIFLIGSLCLIVVAQAQNSAIDDMFKKYSDKEGFTVVTISSRMLGMFASNDPQESDANNIMQRLKSIRILSVEDSLLNKNINFYTELSKKLNLSLYEDLMMVKEGQDVTKFLIKGDENKISELLIISGGPGGNSLISIQGDLNLKNISDLSKSIDNQDIKKLENHLKKINE